VSPSALFLVYHPVVISVVVRQEMLLPDREVYVNAPLRLVTAEYRFPLSAVLSGADLLSLLASELGPHFPIIEPVSSVQVTIGRPDSAAATSGFRLLTRDRRTAVTVNSSRIAVETTEYRHWEAFRDNSVAITLRALAENLDALAGIHRVGLRFINEVRIPSASGGVDVWSSYISGDLLAPSNISSRGALKTVQIALHLEMEDDAELLMRAGILEGRVVDDSGPLRLPSPPKNGPFFLIDIDSFWTPTGSVAEWNTSEALAISDRLHDPIDALFESCITEELRETVLRRKL
jgi:uncharacterized protein (TIGR04255 family)